MTTQASTPTSITPLPVTTPAVTSNKDPTTRLILESIENLNHFVTQSKELRSQLQSFFRNENLESWNLATVEEKMKATTNPTTLALLKNYQKGLEQFEFLKGTILTKAQETFGLGTSGYLLDPLSILIDQIKTGHVDANVAVTQIKTLIRTIGISKMITYSNMIPYVGPIIYGVLKGLDSYTATQAVLNEFLVLLQNLGVPQGTILQLKNQIIKTSFITENYEVFKNWLAAGAPMDGITSFFQQTSQQATSQFNHFFGLGSSTSTSVTATTAPDGVTKVSGGGKTWLTGKELQRVNKHHRKTKKTIQKIKQSIHRHLSRLRGRHRLLGTLRRAPLHKSVAAF